MPWSNGPLWVGLPASHQIFLNQQKQIVIQQLRKVLITSRFHIKRFYIFKKILTLIRALMFSEHHIDYIQFVKKLNHIDPYWWIIFLFQNKDKKFSSILHVFQTTLCENCPPACHIGSRWTNFKNLFQLTKKFLQGLKSHST